MELFQKQYFKPVEYWNCSENAVFSPNYACQGRIAIYRDGARYVSWPVVSILYRYIAVLSHPYYERFELHTILRVVRKGKFSAPAKFSVPITLLCQSLALLDASSWTLGSARPTQKSWTLDHRCFAGVVMKCCTNFGGAVVSILQRTRNCWNGVGHWSSDPLRDLLRWWTLV